MKRIRFRITTLLTVTLLTAIAINAMRPFSPRLTFEEATPSTYIHESGSVDPCYDVPICNDGLVPIWCAASSLPYTPTYMYTDGESGNLPSLSLLEETTEDWIRLDSGESTVLHIPAHTSNATARIGVLVADWRGRTAERWSDSFPSPALH